MIQLKLLYVTFLDHGHESKFNVTDVTGGKMFLFWQKVKVKLAKQVMAFCELKRRSRLNVDLNSKLEVSNSGRHFLLSSLR